jgi:hypothetical protein
MIDPHSIRVALIRAAKRRHTLTYQELSKSARVPYGNFEEQMALAKIASQIGREEFACGRPLLNILIVSHSTALPSESFFKMAKELNLGKSSSRTTFFREHLEKVFSFWASKES